MGSTPPQENGGAAEQPSTNGSAPAAPGFSLSFSNGSRKRTAGGGLVNVQPKEESRREMVSGFSGGQLELEDPAGPLQGGKRMIPKLENTFQVGVGPQKFNPRFLPSQDDPGASEDRFELAAPEESTEQVTYGLSKRAKPSERQANGAGPLVEDALNGLSVTSREWEAARFKQDVETLPEVAGLDAYEAMPVEAFGEAMMRGMGWQEGKSVGKNAKAVVNAKEYVRRPEKLGLGATPAAMLPKPKKYIKQGESREPKKDMIYVDAEGHQKHVKDADAKLVERVKRGVHVGKTMRCKTGTHAGLLCQVLGLEPLVGDQSPRAKVRLLPSKETVSVRVKELGEEHESAAEPENGSSKHKHKEHKHEKKQHKHEKGRSRDEEADEEAAEEDGRERERPWLANHILVKIIDKKLRGGRLYLKKAEVVDVPEPTRCSLVLAEGGETLTGVAQASLETVVPKQEGRRLLLLAGPLRGQRARLLSRNSEAAAVAVQLTADFSIHKLSFDDVSEYAGDFGDEE